MVALLLVVFVNFIGIGALIPVLPFAVIEELGYSETVMTALLASFALAMFVGNPLQGRLSDFIGRKQILLIALAVNITANIWFAFSEDIVSLFVARILAGLAAGNMGVIQAMIADRSSPDQRARLMGFMGAAVGAGFVLGPAIGGLFSGIGTGPIYQTPFLIAAGFGLLALLLALRLEETAPANLSAAAEGRHLFGRLAELLAGPLGLFALGFFFFNLGFAQVEASFVLLVRDWLGFGARETGLLFAWVGLCIILVQGGLIGRVVALLGEMATARFGALLLFCGQLCTVLFASFGLLSQLPALLLLGLCTTMICCGFAFTNPTLSSASSRLARRGEMGGSLGLVQGFGSLGQVIGLSIAGPFYAFGGSTLNFGFAALITLLLLAVILLLGRRMAAV
ncbi:MAG: MFS transporter [Alphaproteobacteria bacterium]|jgi:MFS family permease|nr:MFS transporter [Alphaproteobacteria bacterium]